MKILLNGAKFFTVINAGNAMWQFRNGATTSKETFAIRWIGTVKTPSNVEKISLQGFILSFRKYRIDVMYVI